MYKHTLKKLPKNTTELLVDVSWQTIESEYAKAFDKHLLNLEVDGFRKGKVPAKIAEKHIQREAVYDTMIRNIIPDIYAEIIKKEGLKPVMSPKIEMVKAKEKEDWQIKITVAEKPLIQLGNYKDAVKKAKAEQKKAEIWTPGKGAATQEPDEKDKAKQQQAQLNMILAEILKEVKIEISDLIVDEELNQRLSNLLSEIQKIGLTVESYLKSKNISKDELNKRYKDEIEQTYKLEFALMEIADKENINVDNKDLDKLFSAISDPKEKEAAKANSYFYASVLRKQKTLDYLLGL